MPTKAISDESFETDVLQSDKLVLVDFWAEWCGPCKMIAPALEEIADELGDRVVIAKLNAEDHTDTPTKLGVRGFPTFMLFKDGERIATELGVGNVGTKSRMKAWVESHL